MTSRCVGKHFLRRVIHGKTAVSAYVSVDIQTSVTLEGECESVSGSREWFVFV